jgi:hypothetical protein
MARAGDIVVTTDPDHIGEPLQSRHVDASVVSI